MDSSLHLKFRIYLILTLWILVPAKAQTNYYLSNSGNDSASGRSPRESWSSISRLNMQTLEGGDSILFEQGSIFRGQIQLNQSGRENAPIVFSSYELASENQSLPIISGAIPLEFRNEGNNIWAASLDSKPVSLYSPQIRYVSAREPDEGFYTASGGTLSSLQSDDLNSAFDYSGSIVRVRTSNWTFQGRAVSSSSGNTLSFDESVEYTVSPGWGFFIENKIDFLDEEGEFYYDESQKLLKIYSSQDPGSLEALVYDYGIESTWNIGHIYIEGLNFQRQAKTALAFKGTAGNLQVRECLFSQQEENGISFGGTYDQIEVLSNTRV